MGDPRLNSLHLEPGRRQDYRRARELLLQARGCQTLCAERQGDDPQDHSPTLIRNDVPPPADLNYYLVDRDFLYPLKVGVNTLGRSSDNDVVVEDAFISRRHCAILVHHAGGCELHDTASKNGTFVNGNRVSGPVALKSGDEIRVSGQQFTFLSRSGNPEVPGGHITLSV
jgi:pSer/pThr/pTyr-binding forkhead associated (FHA) protein